MALHFIWTYGTEFVATTPKLLGVPIHFSLLIIAG